MSGHESPRHGLDAAGPDAANLNSQTSRDEPGSNSNGFEPISPLRKAGILLVSLEPTLASKLLADLDRSSVEAVTLEIARLGRVSPEEQASVLAEFCRLGRRRLRFHFEELVLLSDDDLNEAYHDDDVATWALALAGASESVRDRLFDALPSPSSHRLREHLEGLGPFRLADAETAQSELAEHFHRLHDGGVITLPDPDDQDELLA